MEAINSYILYTVLPNFKITIMTKAQNLAISRMNRALKALKDADISICGIDHDLLWATNRACNKYENIKDYCAVANAVQAQDEESGSLKADCYQDSGGW